MWLLSQTGIHPNVKAHITNLRLAIKELTPHCCCPLDVKQGSNMNNVHTKEHYASAGVKECPLCKDRRWLTWRQFDNLQDTYKEMAKEWGKIDKEIEENAAA